MSHRLAMVKNRPSSLFSFFFRFFPLFFRFFPVFPVFPIFFPVFPGFSRFFSGFFRVFPGFFHVSSPRKKRGWKPLARGDLEKEISVKEDAKSDLEAKAAEHGAQKGLLTTEFEEQKTCQKPCVYDGFT